MKYLLVPFLLFSLHVSAQCKSSRKAANGQTINCIDQNDLRQGRWSVRVEGLRGEPGYDEEGVYEDGKKDGIWRVYTLMGDLFAIERYRWGNKDGVSQYFNVMGPVREESWKAVNPENPFDTIDVPDPLDPSKVERRVIKLEGSSVKHGTWKYYNDGLITKTEKYFLDKIDDPHKFIPIGEMAAATDTIKKAPAKVKPAAVLEFEKKNAGKKSVKYRDGKTF